MTNLWSLPVFIPLLSPSANTSQALLASPALLPRFLTGLAWETLLTFPSSFPFWPQTLALPEGKFRVFKVWKGRNRGRLRKEAKEDKNGKRNEARDVDTWSERTSV